MKVLYTIFWCSVKVLTSSKLDTQQTVHFCTSTDGTEWKTPKTPKMRQNYLNKEECPMKRVFNKQENKHIHKYIWFNLKYLLPTHIHVLFMSVKQRLDLDPFIILPFIILLFHWTKLFIIISCYQGYNITKYFIIPNSMTGFS